MSNNEKRYVLVLLSNGDVVEYPIIRKYNIDEKGAVILSLSLTHYMCTDRKDIKKITNKSRHLLKPARKSQLVSAAIIGISLIIVLALIYTFANVNSIYLVLGAVMVYFVIFPLNYILDHRASRNKFSQICKFIVKHTLGFLDIIASFALPVATMAIELIIILLATVGPIFLLLLILKYIIHLNIGTSTIFFCSISGGTIATVFMPSYVRNVIEKFLFALSEDNNVKKSIAEFVRYIYEPNVINFLLNLVYVVLLFISTVLQLQDQGYLINKALDNAILKSFVLFLAVSKTRGTYKDIKMTSQTFLRKLLDMVTS